MFRRPSATLVVMLLVLFVTLTSCTSADPEPVTEPATEAPTESVEEPAAESELVSDSPGSYNFDRSDPEAGVANIMEAFATDETTATCIYEAWGDVANVPPAQLTPELMTQEVCGTSILQLMTGDARFTDDG